MRSSTVKYNSWHTGVGIEWTDKKNFSLEEGEELGDGRAEVWSAIGDGGQAPISLTLDIDGMCGLIFESSQHGSSGVGELLYWFLDLSPKDINSMCLQGFPIVSSFNFPRNSDGQPDWGSNRVVNLVSHPNGNLGWFFAWIRRPVIIPHLSFSSQNLPSEWDMEIS